MFFNIYFFNVVTFIILSQAYNIDGKINIIQIIKIKVHISNNIPIEAVTP